jgi:hypothetical protein
MKTILTIFLIAIIYATARLACIKDFETIEEKQN